MRNLLCLIFTCLLAVSTFGQDRKVMLEALQQWDQDSLRLAMLDQEKLPKKVTAGLLFGGNFSNFIVGRQGEKVMGSYMKVGVEFGGLLDFVVTKHFGIQGQLILLAEQNRFAMIQDDAGNSTNNRLWNFGLEVPVYFMGRSGNMDKGYLLFGAGPYTHFTFASNIGKWDNGSEKEPTIIDDKRAILEKDYQSLYKLHSNHFGVAAMLGYEFGNGIEIAFHYKVSLSDIFTFYSQNKHPTDAEYSLARASLYPQRLSLLLGYRFR